MTAQETNVASQQCADNTEAPKDGHSGVPENDIMVQVDDVSLWFDMSYNRAWTLRDQIMHTTRSLLRREPPKQFCALNSVSLAVQRGDVVGIIGPNGSGKTTLLRVISGIFQPDEGSAVTNGRVSTLLSLGTGFNREMSGLANIRMNALLCGVRKRDVADRIEEVAAFAELGDFINMPMKFYSNGMISRLNFVTLLLVEPEIILIDEIFSVGDLAFEQKSRAAMEAMLEKTQCQLLVTHSLPMVEERCNRAILFEAGQVIADGAPADVVREYRERSGTR